MKHVYSGACRSNLEQIIKVLEFVNIKAIQREASVESGGPVERGHTEKTCPPLHVYAVKSIRLKSEMWKYHQIISHLSPDSTPLKKFSTSFLVWNHSIFIKLPVKPRVSNYKTFQNISSNSFVLFQLNLIIKKKLGHFINIISLTQSFNTV